MEESEPSQEPKHKGFIAVIPGERTAGCVMTAESIRWHPFTSVAVIVCVPAHNPVAAEVVWLLGIHEYVYGAAPPPIITFAVPSHEVLQELFVKVTVEVRIVFCPIV